MNLTALVESIRRGEPEALEEFYAQAHRWRYYLAHELPGDAVDDAFHDVFLMVVRAIQAGQLNDPERLWGFFKITAYREVLRHIERVTKERDRKESDQIIWREGGEQVYSVDIRDPADNPEQAMLAKERKKLTQDVLNKLSDKDREILTDFYILEHDQEQIQRERGLTYTTVRLRKSRALAKCREIRRRTERPQQLGKRAA